MTLVKKSNKLVYLSTARGTIYSRAPLHLFPFPVIASGEGSPSLYPPDLTAFHSLRLAITLSYVSSVLFSSFFSH